MNPEFPKEVTVPPNWLYLNDRLINVSNLAEVKSINNGTRIRLIYQTGIKIEIDASIVMFSFMMNEALLAAALTYPEQAQFQKLKADNKNLQRKLQALQSQPTAHYPHRASCKAPNEQPFDGPDCTCPDL